jgi:hypothetical protein
MFFAGYARSRKAIMTHGEGPQVRPLPSGVEVRRPAFGHDRLGRMVALFAGDGVAPVAGPR